jgi:uncharacterized RDD family membrane protein YckC
MGFGDAGLEGRSIFRALARQGPMETSSPLNPYAPPAAPIDTAPAEGPLELASLLHRWAGAMVDNILALVITWVIELGVGLGTPRLLFDYTVTASLVSWAPFLGVWALQSYFIATRGQSIGKMVMRTRIVDEYGNRASFTRAVVLRTWVFLAIINIPVVGRYLHVIDVLFIFGRGRRCLHDWLAGTNVVRVHPVSAASPP